MDIPDTGAIFTLGKSYLAENTQSYFFIKNDPVKRLISGSTQSAVICDSGRLFVWGENQFGQLGIIVSNSNDKSQIITKPTCVKTLKTLGLKVHDAAFGDGWCVILTNTNEIFFTGRNIFSKDTKIYKNFEFINNENTISIVKKPFRLKELNGILLKEDNGSSEGNGEENFDKLSTGNEHFVLLTSTGRLFGWGSNKTNQLGLPGKELILPVELSPNLKIINFVCGPQSTLIQTEMNQFFITGQLNDFHYSTFTELLFNYNQENVKFLHISKSNEIFFITEKGNIYRGNESTRTQNIVFQRFYDYDSEENGPVVKLLKGTSFFAALTKNYKLFTTFSESGHHLKTFREISKFKNLRVFDIAVGDKHVLVMGIPRSVKNFDKNRFFNQIAAINTPDLNGNSTGKFENINHKLMDNITEENGNKSDVKDNENEQGNIGTKELKTINQNQLQNETNKELQTINEKENVSEMNGTKSLSENVPNENNIDNFNSTNSIESSTPKKQTNSNENQSQPSPQISQNGISHSPEIENKIKTPTSSNQIQENISETNQEINTSNSNVPNTTSSPNEQNNTGNSSQDSDESKGSQSSIRKLQKQESVKSTSSNKISNHENTKISDSENPKNESNTNQTTENENKSTNPTENDEKVTNSDQILSNNKKKSPVNDIIANANAFKETPEKKDMNDSPAPQKSRKGSARSIKFDEKSLKSTKSQDRLVRPNTPYPDGTPQTVKRVQNIIQNNNDDMIENTSPNLADSLENIPEMSPQNSASATRRPSLKYSDRKEKYDEIVRKASAKPAVVLNERYLHLEDDENENDEKLEIEIKTDDILDQTTVNEIRFINNGIDVTEKIQFEETPLSEQNTSSVNTTDRKENSNNPGNSKTSEENMEIISSTDESKLKVIDDDERTTASVNSNKNENQLENDLELKNHKDDLLMQNTQQQEHEHDLYEQQNDQTDSKSKEKKKKKVQRFIDDLKSKGKEMTCRSGDSIRVEDDPPRYTSMDEGLDTKTSKICTIL